MLKINANMAKFKKVGVVAFCFMCLFFAVQTAARYEHQKTETEKYRVKVQDLEKKILELTSINQGLLQTQHVLEYNRKQLTTDIPFLEEKDSKTQDWKFAPKKELSTEIPSDSTAPAD
ncbi:MAG TPA: hypothetical protein ACFYDZ_07075 [Candidatus Brocadiaceae bacterium]